MSHRKGEGGAVGGALLHRHLEVQTIVIIARGSSGSRLEKCVCGLSRPGWECRIEGLGRSV